MINRKALFALVGILPNVQSFVSPQNVASSKFSVKPSFTHAGTSSLSIKKSLLFATDSQETETTSIQDVIDELKQYNTEFDSQLKELETSAELEKIRIFYLGKKGTVTKCMSYMRTLPNAEKPKLGQVVNEIKQSMETQITERKKTLEIEEIERQMEKEKIDVTLPGVRSKGSIGHRHPISMTMEKATEIFLKLGYDAVTDAADSPEIETDYYCFQALNCPEDHPARDMQDTFYLTEDRQMMLRTHTSSVQIRQMDKRKPPFRIVAPGRVYRRDDIDATHSMIFHQVEILAVEERGNLHLGHLKGTIDHFLKNMLGPDIKLRFRGSYFPFTEPSMEVDVFFRGKWLEVLGCGMVDPNVLEMAGIDSTKYSGFAAGFGVERFAMVIHEIDDIRELYKNDMRFITQFPHFYDEGVYAMLNQQDVEVKVKEEELEITKMGVFYSDDTAPIEEKPVEQPTEKKDKKKKKKKKQPEPTAAADIDISKLDIRVGQIVKAWEHPEADKLYCEEIDIGEDAPRQIASGLRAHYPSAESLVGQRVLVLSNLKARKLVGFPSHGMVLCACEDGDGKVVFVEPHPEAKVGERVSVDGFDGEPATENQVIKKKMLDIIFPDLKMNGEGVACYKGVPIVTSAGVCKAQGDDDMKNCAIS